MDKNNYKIEAERNANNMNIVSKGKKSIVNAEQVTSIYIGADGYTIKAEFVNGNGCQLARYDSEKQAQIAMEIIANRLGKADKICYMPELPEINAKVNLEDQKQYHITGRKQKGHGGS